MDPERPAGPPQEEWVAAGHRYQESNGSGLRWSPNEVELWIRRYRVASAPTPPGSQWDFWYNLAFAPLFPQVRYWWFGSAWTQAVWIWGARDRWHEGLVGEMQFISTEGQRLPWLIRDGSPPRISTPLPPWHTGALNLPLRSVLASYVSGLLDGRIRNGERRIATSLVASGHLAAAFPTTLQGWCLELHPVPLREALCTLMQLERSWSIPSSERPLSLPLTRPDEPLDQ